MIQMQYFEYFTEILLMQTAWSGEIEKPNPQQQHFCDHTPCSLFLKRHAVAVFCWPECWNDRSHRYVASGHKQSLQQLGIWANVRYKVTFSLHIYGLWTLPYTHIWNMLCTSYLILTIKNVKMTVLTSFKLAHKLNIISPVASTTCLFLSLWFRYSIEKLNTVSFFCFLSTK